MTIAAPPLPAPAMSTATALPISSSAPLAGPNGSSSGASYVVFGHTSGFSSSLDLSALDGTDGFRINGEAAFDLAAPPSPVPAMSTATALPI